MKWENNYSLLLYNIYKLNSIKYKIINFNEFYFERIGTLIIFTIHTPNSFFFQFIDAAGTGIYFNKIKI